MCGIAGIINKTGGSVGIADIAQITEMVRHRGPDGDGTYADRNLAFGHRRLAIIDLTESGRQPMSYADGLYTITYNGEVYNYVELRSELQKLGHRFRSSSDTEVILAAYAQWGEACVSRFNGMWGFAIHDRPRNVVFCSRDRFGVKPFYYVSTDRVFAFGSEIKQLLKFLPQRRANQQALLKFLITSMADVGAETFFHGVAKLPGGHNLVYDLARHSIRIERFYDLRPRVDMGSLEASEIEKLFLETLTDAIALRLRSDVRVGTCLSGGLDSSTVAVVAASLNREKTSEPFCAITAISSQQSNDESKYARLVADHGGMKWITTAPTYQDFADSLDAVTDAQEEPFVSPSIVMQHYVMKAARDHRIPVLLDGQGGDETLLGYPVYCGAYIAAVWRRHGLGPALRAVRDAGRNTAAMRPINVVKYVTWALSPRARYALYRWRLRHLRRFPPIPQELLQFSHAYLDPFALQKLEVTSTNLPLLLRFEDKNSMAHSIETRLPFLDYRLVEISLSLPVEYKIRDGWTKWILRKANSGRLPETIAWRKNKLGFEAPEKQWLDRHLPEMKNALARSRLLAEMCDMRSLLSDMRGMDLRTQWRLYSTALWEKSYGVAG